MPPSRPSSQYPRFVGVAVIPIIGAYRRLPFMSPYVCASPKARTCPVALTIQYPLPVRVGSNVTYGFALVVGGGVPSTFTPPNARTLPSLFIVQSPCPEFVLGRATG